MDSIKLKAYWCERTLLHLEFEDSFGFQDGDIVRLTRRRGSDPETGLDIFEGFEMTGVYVFSPQHIVLRPMVGNEGNPVRSSNYRIIIKRGEEEAPILATHEVVNPAPPTFKRDDIVLSKYTSSFYLASPEVRDDELWLHVQAKGTPQKFYYRAGRQIRNAWVSLRKSIANNGAVAVYYVFRTFTRVNPNKITFVSDSRTKVSGNMEPLYKRMEERGLMQKLKVRTSFIQENAKGHRSLPRKIQLAYQMATCKVIFCDDYQPYLYHVKLRPGQHLVQLWHACGHFKTVGFGRIGMLDSTAPFSNNHRTYTDVVVAGEGDVLYYAEAFGILDDKIHPLGIPRHDWLLDAGWQDERRRNFKELFPTAEGKKVIVFAPTFRGSGKNSAHYEFDRWDFDALAQFCRENGYYFIFKLHPFIKTTVELPQDSQDVFADGSAIREINDILPSTDILITDYSSVVYEASLLDIPTLYFAYDLEDYISTRDFYEPFEGFVSGPIVRTFDDLLRHIKDEDFDLARLSEFKRKNFKYHDGGSCDRIIDRIVLPAVGE